jgi:hypothetical protein
LAIQYYIRTKNLRRAATEVSGQASHACAVSHTDLRRVSDRILAPSLAGLAHCNIEKTSAKKKLRAERVYALKK